MPALSDLIKYSHKVYEKGLVSATDGNLSIRLNENRIAITKSGVNKGNVTENDIVIVDIDGNKIEGSGMASSEIKIHLFAYKNRKDVNAVVHCHPIYTTAFATANLDLTKPVFPEVILTIGPVPLCKYATPSTKDLPESMKPYITNSWAMMFQNHGAVTFGEDISSAYNRMEKLEHTAKILFISKLLGGETVLSENEVAKLYAISGYSKGIKTFADYNNQSKNHNHLKFDVLANGAVSYSELIDARLRARAGNPVFNKDYSKSFANPVVKSAKAIKNLLSDFNG